MSVILVAIKKRVIWTYVDLVGTTSLADVDGFDGSEKDLGRC